jgi:hypothetical protein
MHPADNVAIGITDWAFVHIVIMALYMADI